MTKINNIRKKCFMTINQIFKRSQNLTKMDRILRFLTRGNGSKNNNNRFFQVISSDISLIKQYPMERYHLQNSFLSQIGLLLSTFSLLSNKTCSTFNRKSIFKIQFNFLYVFWLILFIGVNNELLAKSASIPSLFKGTTTTFRAIRFADKNIKELVNGDKKSIFYKIISNRNWSFWQHSLEDASRYNNSDRNITQSKTVETVADTCWKRMVYQDTSVAFYDSYFFSMDTGFVIGTNNVLLNIEKTKLTSLNLPNSSSKIHLHSIEFRKNNKTGYICGTQNSLWKTVDRGKSWQKLNGPASESYHELYDIAVDSASGSIYIAGECGQVFESKNEGNTWTTKSFGSLHIKKIVAYQGAYYIVNSSGDIYRYNDGAKIKTVSYFPLAASGNQNGLYVFGKNSTYDRLQSTNWTNKNHNSSPWIRASFASSAGLWIAGQFGKIYYQSDPVSGTFEDISIPSNHPIRSIFFIDQSNGYALGEKGSLWKYNCKKCNLIENPISKSTDTICNGANLWLKSGNSGLGSINWSGAVSGNSDSIKINSPGKVLLTVSGVNCTVKDSITISSIDLRSMLRDTSFCSGDKQIRIKSPIPKANPLWISSNKNIRDSILRDSTGGLWILQSAIGSCSYRDSFQITKIQGPAQNSLAHADTLCNSTSLVLDAKSNGYKVLWTKAGATLQDTNQKITITESGKYYLSIEAIQDKRCNSKDSITIFSIDLRSMLRDTSFCSGDKEINIKSPSPNANPLWISSNKNIRDSILRDSTGGLWILQNAIGSCSYKDSFQITKIQGPAQNPLADADTLCNGASLALDAKSNGYKVLWTKAGNTLQYTNQKITITESGKYYLSIEALQDKRCNSNDSITISSIDLRSMLSDTSFCSGDKEINIKSPFPNANPLWISSNKNIRDSILRDSTGGLWVLQSAIGSCSYKDSFQITKIQGPSQNPLADADTLCNGASLFLDAKSNGYKVLWTKAGATLQDTNQKITITESGKYYLSIEAVQDKRCNSKDSIAIWSVNNVVVLPDSARFCKGDSINISLTSVHNGSLYTWFKGPLMLNNNSTNLKINQPGLYSLQAQAGKCISRDSCIVSESSVPMISLAADRINKPCDTSSVILEVVNPNSMNYEYQWRAIRGTILGASNSAAIRTRNAGEYELVITDRISGCSSKDTALVISIDGPTDATIIGTDPTCALEATGNISINTVIGGKSPYQYSIDGLKYYVQNSFSALSAGDFQVFIRDANQCVYVQPISLLDPPAVVVELSTQLPDTLFAGTALSINAAVKGAKPGTIRYQWSTSDQKTLNCTNCNNWDIIVDKDLLLQLQITDANGCTATDTLNFIIYTAPKVTDPDIITGDGNGFTFNELDDPQITDTELWIATRHGTVVYHVVNYQCCGNTNLWKGKNQSGEILPSASYYYVFKIRYSGGKKEEIRKGTITWIK